MSKPTEYGFSTALMRLEEAKRSALQCKAERIEALRTDIERSEKSLTDAQKTIQTMPAYLEARRAELDELTAMTADPGRAEQGRQDTMTTTKELADWLRCMIGQGKPLIGLTMETAAKIGVALDRLAAIDAAVPGEVREIAAQLQEAKEQWDAGNPKVVDGVFEHCGTLLAIVQRGAVALRNTIRDASRAEVEQLRADLQAANDRIVYVRNEANDQRARAEGAERTLQAMQGKPPAGEATTPLQRLECLPTTLFAGLRFVPLDEVRLLLLEAMGHPQCYWCGENNQDRESAWEHIKSCKKHPLVQRIQKLTAILVKAIDALARQPGYEELAQEAETILNEAAQ